MRRFLSSVRGTRGDQFAHLSMDNLYPPLSRHASGPIGHMTLGEKQQRFMRLLPRLLDKAHDLGFAVAGGELERPPATATYYASIGKGVRNSLHTLRLAIDLHLFRDDDGDGVAEYLNKTEDHRELGEWWESQSDADVTCCWGGRFGDGNHYSIAHNGVK